MEHQQKESEKLKTLIYGMSNKTILAMGSHFDDIEVGISGTLLKHSANGDNIKIAILSSDEDRTGNPKIRLNEQMESLKLMGIPTKNLILIGMKDNYSDIVKLLDEIKPDVIYAPYKNDTHQDHRRTSKIAQSIGRKINITTIFYSAGSSINFYPNLFSIINVDKKMEILKCFKSQIKCKAINLNRQKKNESYWGTFVSEDKYVYAEGLIIKKMIYQI